MTPSLSRSSFSSFSPPWRALAVKQTSLLLLTACIVYWQCVWSSVCVVECTDGTFIHSNPIPPPSPNLNPIPLTEQPQGDGFYDEYGRYVPVPADSDELVHTPFGLRPLDVADYNHPEEFLRIDERVDSLAQSLPGSKRLSAAFVFYFASMMLLIACAVAKIKEKKKDADKHSVYSKGSLAIGLLLHYFSRRAKRSALSRIYKKSPIVLPPKIKVLPKSENGENGAESTSDSVSLSETFDGTNSYSSDTN